MWNDQQVRTPVNKFKCGQRETKAEITNLNVRKSEREKDFDAVSRNMKNRSRQKMTEAK